MAEFSKEYQELKGVKYYDFSIIKEFNKLKEGYWKPLICEGFGTKAILRENNECILILRNNKEVNLKDIVKNF